MKFNDISVVILFYKTSYKVIKNLSNYKNFDIYILDQSNDIILKKKIEKKFPKIKYYGISNKNNGFAKGINFLVKKTKSKYFLCTQPDTNITQRSILKLKKTLKIKKDSVITVPKIKGFKNYSNKKKDTKIFTVKKILGAVFLADKKKFMDLNMFDERFFFYWEDVDLCKKIELSNLNIYLNSSVVAKHKGEGSVTASLKTFIIRKVNFKYGEYLYQSKYSKLKIIKILREPIKFLLLLIFYTFTFQFNKAVESLCSIYAIVKFLLNSGVNVIKNSFFQKKAIN